MSETSVAEIRNDRFRDDSSGNSDDSIDLRGIIVTLRKYKWPIILTTALATAATAMVVSSMTPVYRSTATLMFDTSNSNSGFENQFIGLGSSKEDIQTQVEVLKSRTLAERIVDELDLKNHWDYNPALPTPEKFTNVGPFAPLKAKLQKLLPATDDTFEENKSNEGFVRDRMVRKLMNRTSVFPLKQTNLVKVSVEGVDRELATRIANGIGNGYVSFFLDQSDGRNTEARTFLEEKVADLKQQYEGAEQLLLSERQRLGIAGDGSNTIGETIALFTNRLVDAKTALEDARIEWDQVREVRGTVGGGTSQSEVSLVEDGTEEGFADEAVSGDYEYVDTAYENNWATVMVPSTQELLMLLPTSQLQPGILTARSAM